MLLLGADAHDERRPLGQELLADLFDQRLVQLLDAGDLAEAGGRLEGVEAGVGEVVDHPHLLDGGAVDLLDLPHQHGDQLGVGQVDGELVDGHTAVALEDVDPDDVTPHGTDSGGDLTERTGPVGQPHPDEDVSSGHPGTLPRAGASYAPRHCEAF